jgi:hypothetical protein
VAFVPLDGYGVAMDNTYFEIISKSYQDGELDDLIEYLGDWIEDKDAIVKRYKDRKFTAPLRASLQKHIDATQDLLTQAKEIKQDKEASRALDEK